MKRPEVIELSDDDDQEIQITGHRQAVQEVPRPSSTLKRIHEQMAAHFNENRKRVAASTSKDTRPRKQQRTTPISTPALPRRNTPTNVSGNTRSNTSATNATSTIRPEIKRKQQEVIDLCSDEDVRPAVKKPKIKREHSGQGASIVNNVHVKSKSSDSDDGYDDNYASLSWQDELNWKPLPSHGAAYLTSALENMTLSPDSLSQPQTLRGLFVPPQLPHNVNGWAGRYFWTALRKASLHRPPTITRNGRRRHEDIRTPLSARKLADLQAEFDSLTLRSSFRKSSGAINRISQRRGTIAICSATIGGHAEDDSEVRNPHNTANTLMVYRDNELRTCRGSGHNSSVSDSIEKYYTVNDVKFDPNCSARMISSGNDCTVRVWRHLESYDGFDELDGISSDDVPDSLPAAVRLEYTQKYHEPPLDIAYQPPKHDDTCQPDSSVFAVACQDGKLYIYSSDGNPSSESSLSLVPTKAKHSVGAINWGREETSSYLFASSEPSDRQDYTGFHRAYDIRSQKFVYSFSAQESGDAMAVEHFGQRLALFTRGSMESHILRLYDIQRKNGRNPITTISLNDFVTDGEVNCATFSPDGIYLAAARNDNIVDVYDSRNLEEGPLYKFKHQDPNHGTPGIESYGIVEAQWVTGFNGRGLGLISGGNDGCIRLWDVNQAVGNPTNGRVIAQTDFDIGHFSLGDIYKGEMPLVVGDSGGGISIFDRIGMRCHSDQSVV